MKRVFLTAVAGAIIALSITFALPNRYVASKVIRPKVADIPLAFWAMQDFAREITSTSILATRIGELGLYANERKRKELADVVQEMRREIRLEPLNGGAAGFRLSFCYSDAAKARIVIDRLADSVMCYFPDDWSSTPTSVARAPMKRRKLFFLASGVGVGLAAGTIWALLRWRMRWTLAVSAYALAGCATAAGLSFLIPDRYTADAVMRVIPAKRADGTRPWMGASEMADWLRKKQRDISQQSSERGVEFVDLRSHGEFRISFTDRDPDKAKDVVAAVAGVAWDSQMRTRVQRLTMEQEAAKRCAGKPNDYYVKHDDTSSCAIIDRMTVTPYQECLLDYEAEQDQNGERIDFVSNPNVPETPSTPDRQIISIAGFCAGLVIGAFRCSILTCMTSQNRDSGHGGAQA